MTNATGCEKQRMAAAVRMVRAAHDDVPDLSISVRTGEETNEDSGSSGERKRRSPGGKPSGVVGGDGRPDGKQGHGG